MSGGKSSSDSSSLSKQSVWSPQGDVLQDLYGQAPEMLQGVQDQMPGIQEGMDQWTQGVQDQAMPAWQQQMQGGNLGGFDITGALAGSLGGAMGQQTQQQQAVNGMNAFQREGGDNYSQAYKQNFVNDARTAMDTSMQALDARAAVQGMGGGSAYGNAMARGMGDINSNLQSNLANIGYQDYNNRQDMGFADHTNLANLQAQAGGAADQNLLQQQGMLGGLAQQQGQNQQTALAQSGAMNQLGQGQYQNAMMPVNAYSQMMQSIGAPTVLSDSWSISDQSSSQGGL